MLLNYNKNDLLASIAILYSSVFVHLFIFKNDFYIWYAIMSLLCILPFQLGSIPLIFMISQCNKDILLKICLRKYSFLWVFYLWMTFLSMCIFVWQLFFFLCYWLWYFSHFNRKIFSVDFSAHFVEDFLHNTSFFSFDLFLKSC